MFCNNCGSQINSNEEFCSNCGAKVSSQVNEEHNAVKSKGIGGSIAIIVCICLVAVLGVGAFFVYTGRFSNNGFMGNMGAEPETESEEESSSIETAISENQCIVTFESNGGSAVEPLAVDIGATIQSPEIPTREGYIFAGWFVDETLNEMFLFEDEAVEGDMTLYAGWFDGDGDAVTAQNILDSIFLGYQYGDMETNVTRDITLPQSQEDIAIKWTSSNSSIVDDKGKVTRGDVDAEVTLTASVSVGTVTLSKDFGITVIGKRDDILDSDTNYTVLDIQNMNRNDDTFRIKYNDENTQVTSIEGNYSNVNVKNSEDALKVVQDIHSIVGLDNPYEELEIFNISSDDTGATYKFTQYYNGYEVYERRLVVSADNEGVTNLFSSEVIPTSTLSGISTSAAISQSDAEAIACEYYGEGYVAVEGETELIIYTFGEYKASPTLAYKIGVEDSDAEDEAVVFVDAGNGEVIDAYSSLLDVDIISLHGSGLTENNKKEIFPVAYYKYDLLQNKYCMEDTKRKISVYLDSLLTLKYSSYHNVWDDKVAISAYTNLITVYDWFDSKLNWNFAKEYNHGLNLVVHYSKATDNAFWSNSKEKMMFCDNSDANSNYYTYAVCLDVLAHEFTHSIVNKKMGDMSYKYDYRGAINEGYADLFGCLVDGDWLLGEGKAVNIDDEKKVAARDAQSPKDYSKPDKFEGEYYLDPNTYGTRGEGLSKSEEKEMIEYETSVIAHTDSSLIYHAAYLMNQSGMTKDHLAKLWYKSMSIGTWGEESDFITVRKNVISAAKALKYTAAELKIIRKAFDDEELYDERGNLKIIFTDKEGNPLTESHNVNIKLKRYILNTPQDEVTVDTTTGSSPIDINDIYYGLYKAKVTISDCEDWEGYIIIEEGKTEEVVIPVIYNGNGTVSGHITNATTGGKESGVALTVYKGWYRTNGSVVVANGITDSEGMYKFELPSGYYTVKMMKENYTTSYFYIYVNGGQDITDRNASISPIMELTDSYRVVLTWGENPSDLDSHLIASLDDGSSYHVFYVQKNGKDAAGNIVANLDVDDTTSYGPETVTFTAGANGVYKYYVDWYNGSGTWATSNAKVEVYNGDQLIDVFDVPSVDSKSGDWQIFELNNGIYRRIDAIE